MASYIGGRERKHEGGAQASKGQFWQSACTSSHLDGLGSLKDVQRTNDVDLERRGATHVSEGRGAGDDRECPAKDTWAPSTGLARHVGICRPARWMMAVGLASMMVFLVNSVSAMLPGKGQGTT